MSSTCTAPAGGCGQTFRGELPWRLHRATVDGVRVCLDPEGAGLTWEQSTRSWGLGQAVTGRALEDLKINAGMTSAGGQD
ncbi:hypothetical protein GCM10020260_15080 [Nesterenkonia halobia]|uniref:Uncharacterized protein n=1 Tax=Nesterenkonia halobia TaxID=37922 RepID=A0ABP6RC44_9MICC